MKRADRGALSNLLPDLLNAVFHQGMAHARADDAIADANFADANANKALAPIMEIMNKPSKKEIN